MIRQSLTKFWVRVRQDPILSVLIVMAACYFVIYYITDPIKPRGTSGGWFTFYDQGQYLKMAHTLASFRFHELYTNYSYGVGYPLTGVPGLWLGYSRDPFVFFNFFAFIFAIYAVYRTAKKHISSFAGMLAGFGLLFATPLIHYTDQPWNSSVCLVVMSSILLTTTVEKITKKHVLLLGLFGGWAFAARYVDVLFLGPLALASIYRGSPKALLRHAAYMAVGTVLVVLPVLYSHYRVFGSPFRTPYVNHLGIGGVDGSDQGLRAYSARRIPRAGLALFVSPILAGSTDGDRGLLIDFFWALAAIPGAIILFRKSNKPHLRLFVGTFIGIGLVATLFYLSFRASTPGSLKYGELHYFKMLWPGITILAAVFFDRQYCLAQNNNPVKKQTAVQKSRWAITRSTLKK